jgi:hypothetical protein
MRIDVLAAGRGGELCQPAIDDRRGKRQKDEGLPGGEAFFG